MALLQLKSHQINDKDNQEFFFYREEKKTYWT